MTDDKKQDIDKAYLLEGLRVALGLCYMEQLELIYHARTHLDAAHDAAETTQTAQYGRVMVQGAQHALEASYAMLGRAVFDEYERQTGLGEELRKLREKRKGRGNV